MSDAANALGALGSDLAFSVSFGIARELLDAANDAGISEDELVAVVIALSVVFAALPKSVKMLRGELKERKLLGFSKSNSEESASGLSAFFALLVDIAKRISVSISVQLLASNVRQRQTLRAVRIVSLLSISVFFLFLEATSSVGVKARRT
ncbi:MAG: hypothetical protein CMI16_03175 [Opitutaceae bacterium]|nr:hypothetical protein [Opitutaceae bacterium]|tara:strand:+ start:225 stop:677 length:453 start_codon:yes stop_codon:yes gene_type:complete